MNIRTALLRYACVAILAGAGHAVAAPVMIQLQRDVAFCGSQNQTAFRRLILGA
jgi:hypothetical protein